MSEENALDPEVDHRSSESAVVVLPSQTELISGLCAEQVRLLEGMALLAGPVLEDLSKPPIQFAHPQTHFWLPTMNFLAKIFAV
jgi:hypothetical protein